MNWKVFLLALLPIFARAQADIKHDTIFGVALVLDTVWVNKPYVIEDGNITTISRASYPVLVSDVWRSYSVTSYRILIDNNGRHDPRIVRVGYYRLEDCKEIQNRQIFQFKQQ